MSTIQDKAALVTSKAATISYLATHTDETSDQYNSVVDELDIAYRMLENIEGRMSEISPL